VKKTRLNSGLGLYSALRLSSSCDPRKKKPPNYSFPNSTNNEVIVIDSTNGNLCLTGKLNGFLHDGKIFDIGTPAGYEKAIKEWKVPEN